MGIKNWEEIMTSTKRTLAEVEAEIASVKAQLESCRGSETEVYARIVGYYRAVRNWNKGKRDEFNHRKLFEVKETEEACVKEEMPAQKSLTLTKEEVKSETLVSAETDDWHYELFTRPGCPHCPPVQDFITNSELEGKSINVDTDEGMNLAAERGVFSTPTVIFYNSNGASLARAHTVDELLSLVKTQSTKCRMAQIA